MTGKSSSDAYIDKAILVVDDQAMTRTMVKSALKGAGFDNVFMVEDGEQAVNTLETREVDLIIADWKMPGISGMDLLTYVRKSEKHRLLPFIMLTGHCSREAVIEAASAEVSAYIAKPFAPGDLVDKVVKLLEREEKGQKN